MGNYYYLIAGLPDLALDNNKLSFTVADFREKIYSFLSDADKKLIDLFYLKFDNENILKLLKNKEAKIDSEGNFPVEELLENLVAIKESGVASSKIFPSYLTAFIADYYNNSSIDEDATILENNLAASYYAYGMTSSNKFIASWFEFLLTMNNVFTALIARKYKIDSAQYIIGNTETAEILRTSGARDFGLTGEIDYLEQFMKISEIDELLEREKKIDQLKWNWIENETFVNYFSVERIFVFLLQIEMIERWLSLDKEKGSEMFRNIIDSLRNDVNIPTEFK